MGKMKPLLLFMLMVVLVAVSSCGRGGAQNDVQEGYSEVHESGSLEAEQSHVPTQEPNEPVITPAQEQRWGSPVRGVWNGNIWISEFIGMYFYLPVGWEFAGDDEIAGLLGFDAAVLPGVAGSAIDDEFWEIMNPVLYDMMAMDLETGTSVRVAIEKMPAIDLSAGSFIAYNANRLLVLGMNVDLDVAPRQIGGVLWVGFKASMDSFGIVQCMAHFVRVVDGFAISVIVTTINDNGEKELDYFNLFGHITNVPEPSWEPVGSIIWGEITDAQRLPSLERPYANHLLVGIWIWDLDSSFAYDFRADGTGTRGFLGRPESFTWETSGDHLVMRLLLMDESWTFTISGDVLEIDSRQVPGMMWRYIRQ